MTTLRLTFFVCVMAALAALASAADNQCTARPLGGDVAYGALSSRLWNLEIRSNASAKDLTEIRVSRVSRDCGPGPYLYWPKEGIYRVSRGIATWGKVEASDVQLHATPAPSDARILYTDSAPPDLPPDFHGVFFFRSEDGGKTWINPKFRLEGERAEQRQQEGDLEVGLQAISPQDPLTVFATMVRSPVAKSREERAFPRYKLLGLYVSRDGGESWAPLYSKITGIVFVNSWEFEIADSPDLDNMPSGTAALALAPSNPSVMYGYADGDIVKSVDAGRTWVPLSLKQELSRDRVLPHGVKVEFSNKAAFTSEPVPASGRHGSEDAGFEDYYLRQLGLPKQWLAQIIVDPTNENIVYVVAETGIYRTMDGGKSWVLLDLGFDELHGIDRIIINQNDPTQIFVGTSEGLYTSHDRGCHFENVIIPPDVLRCINPQPLSEGGGVTGLH